MTTQIATTTQTTNSFLGGGAQRRIAFLCDGSLAVLYHNGSAWALIQVFNPNTTGPTVAQVPGYPGQPSLAAMPDMWVVNNGTATSDLWFTDTETNLAIMHTTYSASGQSWSWGPRTNPAASSGAAMWSQVIWTGTYIITAYQDAQGGSFAVFANYTSDRTGASGWLAAQIALGTIGSSARYPRPVLVHDQTLGATALMYTQGTTQPVAIMSRLLADALRPDLANWGPEVPLGVNANVTLGGQYDDENGHSGVIDPSARRVHYVYTDSTSGGPRSPGYLAGTPTVDTTTPANNVLAWAAPVKIDTDTAATQPSISVDGSGVVYLYWCTEPTSTNGDVKYVTLASPYTQPSATVNLTNHLSDNNQGSHVPQQHVTAGFVPLVYGIGTTVNGTAPPWKIMLNTSGQPGPPPPPPTPPPPPPPTSSFTVGTSSDHQVLALGTQRKIAKLCDGSYAVLDWDGTAQHLYQVTNPTASPPNVTSIQAFTALNSLFSLPDMFVYNNGTSTSDVWIVDTTTVAMVQHGTYNAASHTWTWDGRNPVPGSSGAAYYVNVIWTGQRLIVAYSDQSGNWGLFYNWTTDRTGATGWSSEGSKMLSSTLVTVVRPSPVLVHDQALGATVCLYFLQTQLVSRVLSDAFTPLLANWGPEQNIAVADVEIAINSAPAYYNNHCAVIDPVTRLVHYAHCDSHGGPSPAYRLGAVTVDSTTPARNQIAWSGPVSLATPSATASSPAIGVDQSSKVYVFWATAPSQTSSDVMYATVAAPYSSSSTPVNLTNNVANNNFSPHVPRSEPFSGFVPVIYASAGTSAWGTSSPWAVVYDNSVLTVAVAFADVAGRFALAAVNGAWADVGGRFALAGPPSTPSVKDVAARFKLAPKSTRPTIFTTSNAAALTLPTQRRAATLCDGSLAVLGFDGANTHLYRVTNPGSASPSVSSVQAFGPLNSFYALADMLVVNNGTSSSEVWIADTTSVAAVQHGVYNAASQSWTWDARTNVPGSTGNAFLIELAWTGTYLICAYQDGGSPAVYYNYTSTKNGTGGWQQSATRLSSGSSSVRPATLLLHDAGLQATVCLYNLGSQVISRVLADSLSPALSNWGPEVNVVAANVIQASVSGYPYVANLSGEIDPATGRVHVAFCDGASSTQSPGYVSGTVTVSGTPASNAVSWAAPISVGPGSASSSSPALGIDRTSKVFLFWATSTSAGASDVCYVTITAPYTSAGAVTNLTGNAAGNNTQPHVPRTEVLAGFVPVVFEQGTASPYKVLLDNSVPTG